MNNIRVRFAPSPTGPLHIGGVRTAWHNYLFAKKYKGTFILRIEDTDKKREIAESEAYIEETLAWLGIIPDESPAVGGPYAPYRQSERSTHYKKYALQLVAEDKAYYAFDTPEALESMRERQVQIGVKSPKYNAITRLSMINSFTLGAEEVQRRLKEQVPYVIRLRVNPRDTIKHKDEVHGWIQVQGATLDDKVLLKEDGLPTYHLANVVDDHLMQITHVIRGEEWLPSTPIHHLLYQGFGWKPPHFVHLPLLLRSDGKGKLSKRTASNAGFPIFPLDWHDSTTKTTLSGFREAGYLPEALLNFLALLGWNPGGNEELMSRERLVEKFSIRGINKAGVRVDQAKLKWFNQQYLKALPNKLLASRYLLPKLAAAHPDVSEAYAVAVCSVIKDRVIFPEDLWKDHRYFFLPPTEVPMEVVKKKWQPETVTLLQGVIAALAKLAPYTAESIKKTIKNQLQHQASSGPIMVLLRLASTGMTKGPELGQVLACLGKKEGIARLKKALKRWEGDCLIKV